MAKPGQLVTPGSPGWSGVNRPEPRLPPERRKTYEVQRAGDRTQPAQRCIDVDCGAYHNGWWMKGIDEVTPLGQAQADYIRYQSGRRYQEHHDPDTGMVEFWFPAGQRCFRAHRPPLYLVRGGDHRGNPRGERRVHTAAEHWVEDLHETMDKLDRARQ